MAEIDFSRSVPVYTPPKPKDEEQTTAPPAPAAPVDLTKSAPVSGPGSYQPPRPDVGDDLKRSAISGAQKSVLGIPGMMGDIQQVPGMLAPLAAEGAIWARKKVGLPFSPEVEAQTREAAGKAGEVMKDFPKYNLPSFVSQKLGGPQLYPPTTEEISKAVDPYVEKAFPGYGPEYKPKTPEGRILKGGIEFVGPGAAGPAQGMLRRGVSALAGGAGSEAGGEYAKGTAYETPARLLGAVGGASAMDTVLGYLGSKGTLMPKTEAKRQLASGLEDYEVESSALAKRLAQQPGIGQAADTFMPRMRQFTRNLLGIDERAGALTTRLIQEGYDLRDDMYNALNALPAAQSLDDTLFNPLRSSPVFKQAEKNARENTAILEKWGVKVPEVTPGKAAVEDTFVQTERGLQKVPGSAEIPETVSNGNLKYYDQVKRELDGIIEQAHRSGDTTRKAEAEELKRRLLGITDNAVPEYARVRDIASNTFTASSAPEAGMKFYNMYDDLKAEDVRRALSSYNQEQRTAFGVGFMTKLEQELASKNAKGIVSRFLKNDDFMEKLNLVFGPQAAGAIRGKVLAENLIQQADRLRTSEAAQTALKSTKTSALLPAGIAGLGTAAVVEAQYLAGLIQQLGLSKDAAIYGGLAAVAAGGGSAVMRGFEKRVAENMVELAKSNKPRDFVRLNKLMNNYPEVYPKLLMPMIAVDQLEEQTQKPKAHGGRIGRKSGGRVGHHYEAARLVKAAELAKKNHGKQTETILNAPDEHVVKALSVANRSIEG